MRCSGSPIENPGKITVELKKLCEKIKYRKNRKNNKCKQDSRLREKAKKGPEKSANVAKIAKVTRSFLAS